MKHKLKSLLAIGLLTVGVTAIAAENFTITMMHAVGGKTDTTAAALIPELERQGLKVDKVHFKTCQAALENVVDSPKNNLAVISQGEFIVTSPTLGGVCPPAANFKAKLEVFGEVNTTAIYLMIPPQKVGVAKSFAELGNLAKTNDKIRVGIGPSPPIQIYLNMLYARNPDKKFVTIIYPSVAQQRAAMAAGDVDLIFSNSLHDEIVKQGGVVLASSVKGDKYPFIQTLADAKFQKVAMKEYPLVVFFVGVPGQVSESAKKALAKAFNSPEFKEQEVKYMATHTGIGKGKSNAAVIKSSIDFEKTFGIVPTK